METATTRSGAKAAPIDPTPVGPPRPAAGGGDTPTTDQAAGGGNGLTRVTVNLTRQAVHALESISESTGYSKTDTINRALQVFAIVQELLDKNGGSIHVTHDSGETERIHIV